MIAPSGLRPLELDNAERFEVRERMRHDGTVIEPKPSCLPMPCCTGGPCLPSEAKVPAPPPSMATNRRGAACFSRSTAAR